MPHIRRGPTDSVSGPAASVPISVNVCTRLPSTAKTWPRRSSETTCWINVMLQTRPMPFPIPKMSGADAADREIGADRADRDAGCGDEERGAVAAVHRQPLDEPERDDVPEQDAAGGERHEHAEARVPGAVRVGRERDLGHVDAGIGERRPAPDQGDRRQVAIVADEREPVANLAPVRAADPRRHGRLEPVADPQEEQRGDEEADRVERRRRCSSRAARRRRPQGPARSASRRSRRPARARSRRRGSPRARGSGSPSSTPAGRTRPRSPPPPRARRSPAGEWTNGSTANVAAPPRSERIIIRWRGHRSISGPIATPRITLGTSSQKRRMLTHQAEPVWL